MEGVVLFLVQLAEPELSESEPPRCGAEGVCGSNLSSLAAAARALSAIQPLAIGEPFGVPPEVRRLGGPLLSGGVGIPSPLLALTNVSLLKLLASRDSLPKFCCSGFVLLISGYQFAQDLVKVCVQGVVDRRFWRSTQHLMEMC